MGVATIGGAAAAAVDITVSVVVVIVVVIVVPWVIILKILCSLSTWRANGMIAVPAKFLPPVCQPSCQCANQPACLPSSMHVACNYYKYVGNEFALDLNLDDARYVL